MEEITDEKEGKSIEQEQMPNTGVVTLGNILERAALGKDLTHGVFQPLTHVFKPVFGFSQLEEPHEKTGSSNEDKEGQSDE